MPRVKIDYVVSFSSEDPEHPASNLLQREVSKKKWLCVKGETSCSVVLQLARAVKISGVHIGAHHAALVEVLVARSETSGEQFQVLVPSSTFVSRESSRREAGVERVRSFGADQLSAARDQRWDRVRVVCSQPYNKHCKYGLSFVHIDEAEGSAATAEPLRPLAFETFSSDEDDFKPGELFAKHLQKTAAENILNSSHNTGAQIRQATSQALKNISESSTKLTKAVINKPSPHRPSPGPAEGPAQRDQLLYEHDDQLPHGRVHHGLRRHREQRDKDTLNDSGPKRKDEAPKQTPGKSDSDTPPRKQIFQHKPNTHDDKPPSDQNRDSKTRKRRRSDSPGNRPGPVSREPHTLLAGAVLVLSGYENPRRAQLRHMALAMGARVQRDWGPGCTHLICAFPNTPKLRAARAACSAVPVARAEWLEQVCARRRLLPWDWFATEDARRRPPPDHDPHPGEDPPDSPLPDSEGDTDDEIEKVLREQKKRRLTDPGSTKQANDVDVPPSSPPNIPGPSGAGVSPGRSPAEDDVSTEDEAGAPPGPRPSGALPAVSSGALPAVSSGALPAVSSGALPAVFSGALPAVFSGALPAVFSGALPAVFSGALPAVFSGALPAVFSGALPAVFSGALPAVFSGALPAVFSGALPAVSSGALPAVFSGRSFVLRGAPGLRRRMERYVRAYGGVVLDESTLEDDTEVDFVVLEAGQAGQAGRGGRAVTPAWLARCHAARALLPP